ncbi:hypothetical protein Tco_0827688 [Tanacetum coccineum]
MPVELGGFDVIISMDSLAKYHAMIVCDEKIVCILYGNEVLIIQGDGSDSRSKSRQSIISCTKTQKYIQKGCQVILTQVMKKNTEDKSKEKRLEDAPIVQDFSEVFLKDLLGLPPTREVKFQINLASPMTKLTQKSVKFDQGEKEEVTFQLLKQKLCNALILALPEDSENFMVYYDVSHKGCYRLELPDQLSHVHSTFHVSNLKKCFSDEPLAIPLDEIQIDDKLHFIEESVEIMDREVKRLK